MINPIFLQDIKYLGKPYWVEIEGYDTIIKEVSGNFAFVASKIMGWNCQTIGDTWKKQKEVNFAPRIRYWEEKPTLKDRQSVSWNDDSRAWSISTISHATKKELDAMYDEYKRTGRTQF